jgi:ribosomal-protein-alanine N-acetyltransferase
VNLRPASPRDIPALIELEKEAPTAAHWSERRYQEIFASSHVPRIALVAESDSISGFLVARAILEEWEIENVVVTPSARRSGIAGNLISHFLSTARAAGAEAVFLEVRESNQPARRLYEKFHFAAAGRRPNYYSHPQEDALVYRLVLP